MSLDASDFRDKAVESISGGLAQLKHLRGHKKDTLSPEQRAALDGFIAVTRNLVVQLSELELS